MSRMRLSPRFALAAAVALMAGGLAVSASAQNRSSPPRPDSPLPAGSYQQSCRGANMNGNILSAQCTNSRGAPVFSSIDTNGCRGRDIANDNGYLRCNAGGGAGPRPPVPPPAVIPTGSYQRTCRSASIRNDTLQAQCADERGRYVPASLNVRPCGNRDIYNDRGRLGCDARGPGQGGPGGPGHGGPGGPGGPGQGGGVQPPTGGNFEAILYTSANYRGQSLRVRGSAPNLAHYPGFNDNVRSIRIVRGRAQVCVDANFRGACQTLSRSVADLNRIGMGNRISSVR